MKMRHLTVMAYLLAGFASTAWAGGDLWMTDFEAAKTKAAKENKYLLVDFTGSDWCIWCTRLNSEVFSTKSFQTEAPKQFVLVELDFPRDKSKLTAEQQQAGTEQQAADTGATESADEKPSDKSDGAVDADFEVVDDNDDQK